MANKIRNKLYHIYELLPGDVFYIVGDRKKTVFTLNADIPFETRKQAGYFIKYANCRRLYPRPGEYQMEAHKASSRAIYLRNINDTNAGQKAQQ